MPRTLTFVGAAISALVLAGCSTQPSLPQPPEPQPLGRDLVIPPELGVRANAGSRETPRSTAAPASGVVAEPTGRLTLQRALAQTLVGSPELGQYSFDIRSAEARTLQAGYRPNPEVSVVVEDFGGNRGRAGFQESQTTLLLSQMIELGGKRASRLQLARLDENLAAWDYEAKRLDVFVETARAFVGLLAAQRKLALAEDTLQIERRLYGAVSERARTGGVSPLEERRAQAALSTNQIGVEQARREVAAARVGLAAMWGSKEPRFERAEGDLASHVVRPPPLPVLVARTAQNPDVARWKTELAQREARVTIERSKNIPDVTIQGGPRHYGDGGSAFVAGVGIPLPAFGMNRGNLLDAQAQLGKGYLQQQAAEARVAAATRQTFERLSAAYEAVIALRRDVLPAAQAAYDGISAGYQQGKFGLIDALDAQRTLSEARNRLVDALATYQTTVAEAERLTGQSLNDAPRPIEGVRSGGKP